MTERMANRDATSGELPHGADSGQGAEGAKAEKEKASAEERSGQSAKPQAAKNAK